VTKSQLIPEGQVAPQPSTVLQLPTLGTHARTCVPSNALSEMHSSVVAHSAFVEQTRPQ
jgi:hypothetical protein